MKNILVTGGAGFIGSHFVRHMLSEHDYAIVNFDLLTYSGNLSNIESVMDDPRHLFVKGDIRDLRQVLEVVESNKIDTIVNFAAESHVDRSIVNAGSFVQTDVYGTYVLLEVARRVGIERFVQISTDEVYGGKLTGEYRETDPLEANNPYSASKAGADLMARVYHKTYGLPVVVTRGCNTIGPNQYPEKVVPLFTTNAIDDKPLPIYGDGKNVREYMYVADMCAAIDKVLHEGIPGEAYNVGTGHENIRSVIEVAEAILSLVGRPRSLIRFVEDRPNHDKGYPMNVEKIRSLGWKHRFSFGDAIEATVRWYVENQSWWRSIKERDPWFKNRG